MADKPTKRRVKNPETFREAALKGEAKAAKTRSPQLGKATKSVKKALAPVLALTPLMVVGKVFKFVFKILIPPYFRNSWKELKLVTWPGWRESRRLTYAVLVFAIVFGASIALVDLVLDKVFKNILLK